MSPEEQQRFEVRAEAQDTLHSVQRAEYRTWPDQRPAISTAGYTDINGVEWIPLRATRTSLTTCTVPLPPKGPPRSVCGSPGFLWADSEMYGGQVTICASCFRSLIFCKPKKLISKWFLARAIQRRQLEAAQKSAEWVLSHARHHTAQAAYIRTRN